MGSYFALHHTRCVLSSQAYPAGNAGMSFYPFVYYWSGRVWPSVLGGENCRAWRSKKIVARSGSSSQSDVLLYVFPLTLTALSFDLSSVRTAVALTALLHIFQFLAGLGYPVASL